MSTSASIRSIVGKVGLLPVVATALTLPIVSFFSFIISLSIPPEAITASSLAGYTFFLLGSIAATFAFARIADFLLTGLLSLATELYNIIRASLKSRNRSITELTSARYELLVIRSIDRYLSERNNTSRHYIASIALSLYFYWFIFLGGNLGVFFLGSICVVFLFATNGMRNRKRYPTYLSMKGSALRGLHRLRKDNDSLNARIKEADELIARMDPANVDPVMLDHYNSLKSEFLQARNSQDSMEAEAKKIRFIAIRVSDIPRVLYSRIRIDFDSALENPIGLSAILLAVAIYVGYARADTILNSNPGEVSLSQESFCGRILFVNDDGYFVSPVASVPDSKKTIYVSKGDFVSFRYGKDLCKQ